MEYDGRIYIKLKQIILIPAHDLFGMIFSRSFVFNVGEELCVDKRVFVFICVHREHKANCATKNNDQDNWNPKESLGCN